MNKAGFLPSGRVMVSHALKRYYEPLRLPLQPTAISLPYTRQLMFLKHHHNGSPALGQISSTTCHPCYPGRLHRPLPLSESVTAAFPLCPEGRHLLLVNEATNGFTFVTACCFANWELTTLCYQNAAPLNYRGESDNSPDGT